MLDTTGGTCYMEGWWKHGKQLVQITNRSKPQAMHKYHQISTGRFESGNGKHGCDEKTDGLAQPRQCATSLSSETKRQCSDLGQVAWLELHVNPCSAVQERRLHPERINSFVKSMGVSGGYQQYRQGGGGSFKDRKPIGKTGCCASWMAERTT